MTTIVKIKGVEHRIYKMYYNGNCELAFFAKSERQAKIKISNFCKSSVTLYKVMGGVYLCDEYERKIAVYSPFFYRWQECAHGSILGD